MVWMSVSRNVFFVISFVALFWCHVLNAEETCNQPEVPENGHIVFANEGPSLPGTKIRYECDAGYVRLGPTHRQCLKNGTWSERAPICANVAIHKPTRQSSTASHDGVNFFSNFSTDGDFQGQCSATHDEPEPWLEIDLLQHFKIYAVEILFQKTSLKSLEIRIRQEQSRETESQLCYKYSSELAAHAVHSFVCEREPFGRYVSISVAGARDEAVSLSLCEVSVLSRFSATSWLCSPIPGMETWDLFRGTCYYGSSETQPWFSAGSHCRLNGASMLVDIAQLEQRFLATQLRGRARPAALFYWTGLTNTRAGDWKWITGESLTEAFWANGSSYSVSIDSELAYAAALSRNADWNWVPSVQGLWYHWICSSKPLYCASPGVPAKGGVMLSSPRYTVGSIAYYYCSAGYQLRGAESRVCSENGTWSSSEMPVCVAVTCVQPEAVHGAELKFLNSSTGFGSVVKYQCLQGMKLEGPSIRKCQVNGLWSDSAPSCTVVDCGIPDNITYGFITYHHNSTVMGSIIQYECFQGFALVGSSLRHCSSNGQWTPDTPVCYDASVVKATSSAKDRSSDFETSSNHNPTLHITVGFLAIFVVLSALVAVLLYWMWKRRKYDKSSSSQCTIYTQGSDFHGYSFTNSSFSGDHVYYSTVPPPGSMQRIGSALRDGDSFPAEQHSHVPIVLEPCHAYYPASSTSFGITSSNEPISADGASPSESSAWQSHRQNEQLQRYSWDQSSVRTVSAGAQIGRMFHQANAPAYVVEPTFHRRQSQARPTLLLNSSGNRGMTVTGAMLPTYVLSELNMQNARSSRQGILPSAAGVHPCSALNARELKNICTMPRQRNSRPCLENVLPPGAYISKQEPNASSSSSSTEAPSNTTANRWFGTIRKKLKPSSDRDHEFTERKRRKKKSRSSKTPSSDTNSASTSASANGHRQKISIVHLTPIEDQSKIDQVLQGCSRSGVAAGNGGAYVSSIQIGAPDPRGLWHSSSSAANNPEDTGDSFSSDDDFGEDTTTDNERHFAAATSLYADPDEVRSNGYCQHAASSTASSVPTSRPQQADTARSIVLLSESSKEKALVRQSRSGSRESVSNNIYDRVSSACDNAIDNSVNSQHCGDSGFETDQAFTVC